MAGSAFLNNDTLASLLEHAKDQSVEALDAVITLIDEARGELTDVAKQLTAIRDRQLNIETAADKIAKMSPAERGAHLAILQKLKADGVKSGEAVGTPGA